MNLVFITINGNCYFKYNGINYELNIENLNLVKETMIYPCKIEFYNYSKQLIRQILKIVVDENILAITSKEENGDYEIILTKSRFQQQILNRKKSNYAIL